MMDKQLEIALIEFLARIYGRIPWKRIKVKSPYSFFGNKVSAASRRGTAYEFANQLCKHLSIQSIPEQAISYLDMLKKDQDRVLDTLSREHIPYCMKAIMKAGELKEIRNRIKGGDNDKDAEV